MATLANVSVNSRFIDLDSTFDGESIEWVVAGQSVDGEGITTLVGFNPLKGYAYDAKEPDNTSETIRNNGNANYAYSNILQWLNSDKGAGEWYEAQHEYDQAPNSSSVISGELYANKAGFLNGFSQFLLSKMQTVTKCGASRKVHLIGYNELGLYVADEYGTTYTINRTTMPTKPRKQVDDGATYGNYGLNFLYDTSYSYRKGNFSTDILSLRLTGNWNDYIMPYVQYRQGVDYGYRNLETSGQSNSGVSSASGFSFFVIYVDSSMTVHYDTSKKKYYADRSPQITVNNNLGQHRGEFNFNINVSDADGDSVSVKAYVDDDSENPIFNSTVSLDADTSVTVPSSVMSGLEYGNHTISIIADDGDKTTTATTTFEKYDVAPNITVQSDMGQKKYTFNFSFQVSDTDDTKSAVTVKLDDKQIYSNDNAPINEDISVQIATADFNALSYDTHTLTITASDGIKTGTATATFQRIEISAPVITADEIGNKADAFSTTYQVSSKTADSINVVVKLDNAEIDNKTNVSQNTDITLSVSASRFNSLNYGEHTIAITATNNDGYSSTRTLVFKKCSIPTVRINGNIGQVDSPFSVEVVANSADGGAVTVKAYIDGKEIET